MVRHDAKSPPRARAGKATVDGGELPARDGSSVVDTAVAGPSAEPAPRAADPSQPYCRVHGESVAEFRALIDGKPGTVITDRGTWVFDRVFYERGQFNLGDGFGRTVAGQQVVGADFTAAGLTVKLTGYTAWIPAQSLKVSWKVPPPA